MVLACPKASAPLSNPEDAELQIIVDGTDSNTAGIVLQYSAKIAGEFSRQVLVNQSTKLRGATRQLPQVELKPGPGSMKT